MEPDDIARAAGVDRATLVNVSMALFDAGWRMPLSRTPQECEADDVGHIYATQCVACGHDPLL